MPTVRKIEDALFAFAPKSGAMEWDNVGLLVGDPEQEVSRAVVSLDVTEAVADEAAAQGAQLIVSHHPVMNCAWLPVQSVREDTAQGRLLRKLIRSGLSVICMHTNLDMAAGGVNDALAYVLKLVDPGPLSVSGLGRVGTVPDGPVPLPDFLKSVSGALHCGALRYADGGKPVSRVAVGGGACGEEIPQALAAGCDTFVTADLRYHDFQSARPNGMNLIDAGHFPTEDVICPVLVRFLSEQFPALTIIRSASNRDVVQYYFKGD